MNIRMIHTLKKNSICQCHKSPYTTQTPITLAQPSPNSPTLHSTPSLWRPISMHQPPRKREQPLHQLTRLSEVDEWSEREEKGQEGDEADFGE